MRVYVYKTDGIVWFSVPGKMFRTLDYQICHILPAP